MTDRVLAWLLLPLVMVLYLSGRTLRILRQALRRGMNEADNRPLRK